MASPDPDLDTVIVIDNGSQMTKAGIAGESEPRCVVPTITGYPRNMKKPNPGDAQKDYNFIGNDALAMPGMLSLKHPIEKGVVTDWDEMLKIWNHVFYEHLRISPDEATVLLTEPALNPKENREKMVEIMFDFHNVSTCSVQCQPVLTLFDCGKTTGVVVHSGHTATRIVPIHEARVIAEDVNTVDLAGKDINQYLLKLVEEEEFDFTSSFSEKIVKNMKEKMCYTALEFESELALAMSSSAIDQVYELPDGTDITLGHERIRCPEVLFQPSLNGHPGHGMAEHIVNCINSTTSVFQGEFYKNIVLSGGTANLPGFQPRLEKEVKERAPPFQDVAVQLPSDPSISSWVGGSLLACTPDFRDKMCVSKAEYEEHGPNIIHHRSA